PTAAESSSPPVTAHTESPAVPPAPAEELPRESISFRPLQLGPHRPPNAHRLRNVRPIRTDRPKFPAQRHDDRPTTPLKRRLRLPNLKLPLVAVEKDLRRPIRFPVVRPPRIPGHRFQLLQIRRLQF